MSATTLQESAAPYGRNIAAPKSEAKQRVILHGVKWSTYKSMLKDLGDSRACRLAFNAGKLEIMSPLFDHEGANRPFGVILFVLAEEMGFDYLDLGSLTCNRDDLMKGIEPDSCFYIANAHKIIATENRRSIDLRVDPPPDIMVEIDVANNSMDKLPICEALRVPEHWRYVNGTLEIRVLKGKHYIESVSAAFPGLDLRKALPQFIPLAKKGVLNMSRQFRTWVRAELLKSKPNRSRKPKPKK